MDSKLAVAIGALLLIIFIYYNDVTKSNTVSWAYANSISDCDIQYKEASREQSNPNGRTYTLNFSMNAEDFFDQCAEGNSGPWSEACPFYQQCIASVKNKLPGTRDIKPLNYTDTAKYIRSYLIENNILKNTTTTIKGKSENIYKACSNPHERGNALAGMIYGNIPEVPDFKVAEQLALKANTGYGECICVLSNYLNLDVNMSIGKCETDKFKTY